MINNDLWKLLEKVGTEDLLTKAYLLNLDDQKQRFEFMFLPSNISIEGSNSHKETYAMFGKKGYLRYESSQLCRVQISDLIFTVPRRNRSMIPIERGLESLRYPLAGKLEPPLTSFVFGKRSIQPLRLESYSVQELEHINGTPTALSVGLSFIASDIIKL